MPTSSSPRTASTAARAAPHEAVFEPDIDTRECRYIWLGTTKPFPAFTFAFEETEHGWFQVHAYQFSKSLSTVIVETREETWRAHGLDKAEPRAVDRVLREAVREVPRRPRAHEQRRAPARLRLAQLPARALQALAPRQPRADRRRRAHRALLDRLRHQARDGGRDRARRPDRRQRGHPGRARRLPGGALDRGAEAAERGPQPHALVRERRALHAARTLAVHLQPADRQPAHRPREPEAARPGLRRARRGEARRARGRDAAAAADVPAARDCAD